MNTFPIFINMIVLNSDVDRIIGVYFYMVGKSCVIVFSCCFLIIWSITIIRSAVFTYTRSKKCVMLFFIYLLIKYMTHNMSVTLLSTTKKTLTIDFQFLLLNVIDICYYKIMCHFVQEPFFFFVAWIEFKFCT